mmetsp:Transcript_35254/g.62872  ORF Transcript_35254/g.62872 Transcript_35254/m.62872 type:complete len:315 (-) Transcript_35254:95-1039(-)
MATGISQHAVSGTGVPAGRRESSVSRFIHRTTSITRRNTSPDEPQEGKFIGPLATIYPGGVILRPEQRYTEAEWAPVMGINPNWPNLTAEGLLFTSMWQGLLSASDLLKRALSALAVLASSNKVAVKGWMIEAVANALQRVSMVLDTIWEVHTKQLHRMAPELQAKFPRNLETLHIQVHKKLAMLTQTFDGATLDQSMTRASMQRVCDGYGQCCGLLRNLARITLEDSLFFYRSSVSEATFMSRVEEETLTRNEEVNSLLVGATPAGQRPARFKKVLGMSGVNILSNMFMKSLVVDYEKNFVKPLQNIVELSVS